MILEVRWEAGARRDLKRLDPQIRRRVIEAVQRLAETGQGDVKRLVHSKPPQFRLRVGDWRVRFTSNYERGDLNVLRVLPRREAYR